MTRTIAIAAAALLLAMLGVTWWLTLGRGGGGDAFAACRESAIAGGTAAIGGPFTLVNGEGETVTEAEVLTKPSLVYFGYTFCPDVCPLDVARNAEAVDLLDARGHDVQPVFISIDPGRDTPEVVGDYAGWMHEKMIGLTGSEAQVREAARAYKAFYSKQETGDEFYLVDHSTFTYLMLPGHGFAEFFRRDDSAEAVAERAACFIEAASN